MDVLPSHVATPALTPGSERLEEEFRRTPPEESGANDIRNPVRVVPHTPEPIEQDERVGGTSDIPLIIEVFTEPGRQRVGRGRGN